MKIVIIVNSRDLKNGAGMNRVIYNSMPELINSFKKVIVVSSNSYLELIIGLIKIIKENPFTIDFFIFNSLASVRKQYNKYWSILFNFSTLFKIKKVIYWHEMPNYFQNFITDVKFEKDSKKIVSKFSERTIKHMSVSHKSSEIVSFFNKSSSKVVINNCITKNENVYDLKFDKFTITTVGSIQHIKGTDIWVNVAIETCKKYSNIQFLWCGSVLDKVLFENCLDLIKKNNFEARIRFLGNVESAYVVTAASDLFYSSSRIDSFPLSVIEAMAYGKNIIYYESGGIEEAVGKHGYKIQNFDIKETVKILSSIIDKHNSDNYEVTNFKLIQRYYDNYTPEIFVKKVYSELKKMNCK